MLGPHAELHRVIYLAERARDVRRGGDAVGESIPTLIKRQRDRTVRDVRRLLWVARWCDIVAEYLSTLHGPVYVGVEGYAYSQAARAHQIGEVGGALRQVLMVHGHAARIHDPHSLKMFAAGRGDAGKEDVIEAVRSAGYDFTRYGGAEEDLSDACALALLVRVEVEVRAGRVGLDSLPEYQRRVFLRTTRAAPTNILDREWVRV